MATCKTPGSVYGTSIRPDRIILAIEFPVPLLAGITPEERDLLTQRLHAAILPIIELEYRGGWSEHFAGKWIDNERMPSRHSQL